MNPPRSSDHKAELRERNAHESGAASGKKDAELGVIYTSRLHMEGPRSWREVAPGAKGISFQNTA
jgi:hypothetical protein